MTDTLAFVETEEAEEAEGAEDEDDEEDTGLELELGVAWEPEGFPVLHALLPVEAGPVRSDPRAGPFLPPKSE